MKTISLISALGAMSLVLVVAYSTLAVADRSISMGEPATAIPRWSDASCASTMANDPLTSISPIADDLLRVQRTVGAWPCNEYLLPIFSAREQLVLTAEKNLTDSRVDSLKPNPVITDFLLAYARITDIYSGAGKKIIALTDAQHKRRASYADANARPKKLLTATYPVWQNSAAI